MVEITNNWPVAGLRSSQRPQSATRIRLDFRSSCLVLLLLLPIYLLVLRVEQPSFYFEFAVALCFVLSLCTYMLWKEAGWLFASVLVAAICLQNLYLGALLNFQTNPLLVPTLVLIETKTAILYGGFAAVVLYALRKRKRESWKSDRGTLCGIIFLVVLTVAYLLSSAPVFSKVAELRNLLCPIAAWYLGKFCVREEGDFRRVMGIVFAIGVVLSVISVLELTTTDLWGDYLQKGTLVGLKGPTADDTDFLGFGVMRLYTGVGSPINASFIFALLFLLALFLKRHFLASIFGIQSLLTFSKAGIAVGLFGLGAFLIRRYLTKAISWARILWVAPVILLLLGSYLSFVGSDWSDITDVSSQGWSNTAVGHIRGLVGGIVQLPSAPWGHGLGVSGNMSEVGTVIGMTGTDDSDPEHRFETGGESTIGTILYQLGILGFISFAGWCLYRVRELFYASKSLRPADPQYAHLALAAMAALLGVFISCFGSESAMVPQTGGIIFLLGGMVAGLNANLLCQAPIPSRK
jgi:hypothetical protein